MSYDEEKNIESTETTTMMTTSDGSFVIVDAATGEEKEADIEQPLTESPIAITVTTEEAVKPEIEDASVDLVDKLGSTASSETEKEPGTCEERNLAPNNTPVKADVVVGGDNKSNVEQSIGSNSDATAECGSTEQRLLADEEVVPAASTVAEDNDKSDAKQSIVSDSDAPAESGSTKQRLPAEEVVPAASTVVEDPVTTSASNESSAKNQVADGANVSEKPVIGDGNGAATAASTD